MNRTSFAAKTIIATVALTALGVAAATPASAHTSNMYAFIYDGNVEGVDFPTFGTWSKTDGTVAPLATGSAFNVETQGIEVDGEKGTAVGLTDGGAVVFEWNHSTGETGVPITLYINQPDTFIESISGLDSTLDSTKLTLVYYATDPDEGLGEEYYAVATVNPGTGEVVPVVDLTTLLGEATPADYSAISIATDPLGGGTFVFLQNSANESFFLKIDIAANTYGDPTLFQGTGFDIDGQIYGADFDGDGTLYFVFDNYQAESFELSKTTGPSTWVTATRTTISDSPANEFAVAQRALTIEWTKLAATGSELPVAAFLVLGTVAVVAGGLTVMVARRRSERGVV